MIRTYSPTVFLMWILKKKELDVHYAIYPGAIIDTDPGDVIYFAEDWAFPMKDDDLNNEESLLSVPTITVTDHQISDQNSWEDLLYYVNHMRRDQVFSQQHLRSRQWSFYFKDRQEYIDFVTKFPWVLKGTDEPI